MITTGEDIRAIAFALERFRLSVGTEAALQSSIQQVLSTCAVSHIREHRLTRGPIDFYLPTFRIGIEAKIDGGPSAVLKQIADYIEEESVDGLILVTTKTTHTVPETLRGKPVRVVRAWRQSL